MDVSGTWIVFTSWMRGPQTIMKIPAKGGERIDLTTENGNSPVISSDGQMVYFISTSNGKRYVSSIPIAGGTIKRLFEAPKNMSAIQLRPKYNEISYLITTDGVVNVYTRPIDGGVQKQFTRFDEKFIAAFAWTPDGRSLVVSRGEIRSDVVILSEEKK